MTKYLLAYAGAALTFCVLDGLWLGFVARGLYQTHLGPLMLDSPRWGAAVLFYAVFLVGVVAFGSMAGLRAESWTQALLWGALFGFFTYFTYDMTNLATLKGWSVQITLVDVAWGTVLTAASSVAGYAVASRWG